MFIITEEQIKNKIYNQLMKQNEHIIKDHMAYEYFNLFWNNISLLYKGGILTSSKSVDKFFNKLQLMNSYNRNQCFQGLSEMMFWLYSIRMNYDFEIDKQLHTKSEYNNSDIDIQILKDGYRFNIEVKTPNQIEKDESVFNISIPFRVYDNKEIQDEKLRKVIDNFSKRIISNSQGKYTATKQTKIDDNKVIEYLKSGQKKFNFEERSINVLALSVTSNQMNDYWGYLCNPSSGIFTDKFAGLFFDKNNKEVNPFSQRTRKCSDIEAYKKLLEILPNDTLKFKSEHDKRNRELEKTDIPIDLIFFYEYLHDNYKLLCEY